MFLQPSQKWSSKQERATAAMTDSVGKVLSNMSKRFEKFEEFVHCWRCTLLDVDFSKRKGSIFDKVLEKADAGFKVFVTLPNKLLFNMYLVWVCTLQ